MFLEFSCGPECLRLENRDLRHKIISLTLLWPLRQAYCVSWGKTCKYGNVIDFSDLPYSFSEVGTKEDPMVAETINPIAIRQQKDMREKLAAMKEKRLLNQKLG